jgi:hypothetical protein
MSDARWAGASVFPKNTHLGGRSLGSLRPIEQVFGVLIDGGHGVCTYWGSDTWGWV